MRIKAPLPGVSLAAAFAGLLIGGNQAKAAENPVHWLTASVPKRPITLGAGFTVKLLARIDPGWHLYAVEQEEGGPVPMEISLADQSFLTLGSVHASKPIQLLDRNFDKRVSLYIEKAEFTLPLMVAAGAPAGLQHAALHIRYQCCNETMCLAPRTAAVDLAVSIKAQR